MLKRTVAALFGLVFALTLVAPPKANAAVMVGVGVRPAYGYSAYGYVAHTRPYAYVAPVRYVSCAPGYVYPPYVYPGRVVVGRGYRYAGPRGYGWRR